MAYTLSHIVASLGGVLKGRPHGRTPGTAGCGAASDITFLSNPKYRKQLDDVPPVP
jgi:UDP-3-O-[3-hydroxymyristoyl] glucosamine N-acyltransferase